jgi:dihydrofolate synthase/folylpolyglutamate synthase
MLADRPVQPTSDLLADWLAWLEELDPTKIELGLDRIREVYSRLPALNKSTKVVTIAGTNGKGSCLTALQAAALAAGKTVIAYSSPHILQYNERIQVQGVPVADQDLVRAFREIAEVQNSIFLTYFEFATLAALCIAEKQRPDLLILEVGLGGRLDSVNLIDADIVVLTAIGMDHMDWLGDDIESIAYEKCGVIRKAKPLVLSAPDMPQTVSRIAAQLGVELYSWGREFQLIQSGSSNYRLTIGQQDFALDQPLLHPNSIGGALMAFHLLWPGDDLPTAGKAATTSQMPGRYQKLNIGSRQVILDVAHNPMALAYLVEKLKQEGIDKVELIFAMMSDKDYSAAIDLLFPVANNWKLLQLDNSRALPVSMVAEKLRKYEVENIEMLDVLNNSQWKDIFLSKSEQCPLLVTGSFYTVSAILEQPEVKALLALS